MGKMKSGFTLVEVLTVAGIMALFSLTLVAVFLATIRGGVKSRLLQRLHQDGGFSLTTMTRAVRKASIVSCGESLDLTDVGGGPISYSLVEAEAINRLASNSGEFLTGTVATVIDLSFSCYQGTFGNQVVTIEFTLEAVAASVAQAQEKLTVDFATSVSTRQK